MTHDNPASCSATAEVSVVLGAICDAACLPGSSDTVVSGPKAAAAAAVIDSLVDQKDTLDLSFRRCLEGASCSSGFSPTDRTDGVSDPSSTGCSGRATDLRAAGRRRWKTSLAPGPAAGTRSSTSRWRMRSALTCKISQRKVKRRGYTESCGKHCVKSWHCIRFVDCAGLLEKRSIQTVC